MDRLAATWLLLRNTVARLRDSDTHRSQHRADVRRRTIMCLLELAQPHARDSPAERAVVLRLTQQSLADMVPASLVSVTRALEELRRFGALATGRGRIIIDVDLLRALLSSEPW